MAAVGRKFPTAALVTGSTERMGEHEKSAVDQLCVLALTNWPIGSAIDADLMQQLKERP